MGLMILTVLLFIVFVYLGNKVNENFHIGSFIAGVTLFMGLCPFLILNHIENNIWIKNSVFEAEYILKEIKNDNITGEECVDVYNKSIEINKKININKKYCNNFWVGWFYSKEIGELILIDIGRIPSVKSKN